MWRRTISPVVATLVVSLVVGWPGKVDGRGFGGGGFGGGDRGGYGGDRGGGMGSVRYSGGGQPHDTYRPQNYGSLQYGGGGDRTRGDYSAANRPPEAQAYRGGWEDRPAGGSAAWERGPAGGAAARVQTPAGGTAAAYKTPYGSAGAVVHGPGGDTAAVFHGPGGGTVAGARGVNGGAAVAALPPNYAAVTFNGANYYHYGNSFYRPYWYGGSVCYWPVSAPIGWYTDTLPSGYIEVQANGATYYSAGDTYYQPAQQNGQQGYQVVADPWGGGASSVNAAQPDFAATVPDPFKTLQAMSTCMGKLDHFAITVQDTFDEVTTAGQKIQLTRNATIKVQRPNQVAVDYHASADHRQFVYDGTQLTAIDLAKNVYGVIPLSPPLDAALDTLAKDYGMAMPVHNLLYTDVYDRLAKKIEAGQYVGHDTIGDTQCDHLAFRQADIDWEIWVQQGDTPLPRRLSIVHRTSEGAPRYRMEVSKWDTSAIPASAFQVQIPAGAMKTDVIGLTKQPGNP